MSAKAPAKLLEEASAWWSTQIIDIHPGEIRVRGYPIEELIGALSFPQMIWLMLRGEVPGIAQAKLLEAALVAAVDHGPHAPSIAIARMAVTCGLPVNGAMASSINVLDDIHGGAGQQCMELLHRIATRARGGGNLVDIVEDVLEEFTFEHGKIVPGYGHRFHPIDPRAPKLVALVRDAKAAGICSGIHADAGELIERSLSRRGGKRVPMNIDGATAVVYSELGFAPPFGRGLFILSRSVGILAHAMEQAEQGGRIKGPMPTSIPFQYTGLPSRHYDFAAQEQPIARGNGRAMQEKR
jgi:citrate synthase